MGSKPRRVDETDVQKGREAGVAQAAQRYAEACLQRPTCFLITDASVQLSAGLIDAKSRYGCRHVCKQHLNGVLTWDADRRMKPVSSYVKFPERGSLLQWPS